MRGTRVLYSKANLIASPGERIGLVGPNGCGKTSLLKVLLHIYKQTFGDFRFGVPVSVPELVVGMIGAVIASLIYQLFVFSVDYSRTEYTQFEDDDYYYYVKAVPKIAISRTDVKVQEINKVKRR